MWGQFACRIDSLASSDPGVRPVRDCPCDRYRWRLRARTYFLPVLFIAIVMPIVGNATTVEAIVVTARKRVEGLDVVPQTMAVLTGDDIERRGLMTSPELAHDVPNLTWQSILGLDTPQIFLRGIGNATYNANQANPVAVHTDGIYQGSNIVYGFGLLDLDRIEILKGPQGTLFGRNTTGGVINFIAHKPDVAEGTNGYASATYGRFNEADVDGAAGFALGDHVAVRIAGQSLNRDGYVTNRNPVVAIPPEGRVNLWSARGEVRFQNLGNLDLLLSAHGGRNRNDVPPGKQIGVVCPPGITVARIGACMDFFGFRDTTNPWENFTNIPSHDFVDSWGVSATATWTLSRFDLVSQTAVEGNNRRLIDDSDNGPAAAIKISVVGNYHQFSQELRAVSHNDERLTWLAGGNFYSDRFYDDQAYTANAFGPGFFTPFFPVEQGIASSLLQRTRSFAGFSEASYRLTSRLTFTAGARWTSDHRSADTNAFLYDATGLALTFVDGLLARSRLLAPTISPLSLQRTWGKWSGRGIVSYALADGVLSYAQVSHGFKGGDFNGGAMFAPAEATITNPEYVTDYEIGLRGSAFDRHLTFSGAAFYYDFSNQQVAVLVPGSHATLQSLANAAKTHVKGLEAEVAATPIPPLYLEAKAGYLDARFVKFQLDASNVALNFDGNRTASSPRVTFAGLARYGIPIGIGTLSIQFDISYAGSQYFTVDNNPSLRQGGYWLANSRVTFEMPKASVAFWVKNLGDRTYYVSGLGNAGLGFLELIPGLPRTFGVTVTRRF
ncbi:MAG: hypothetical protein EPO08_13210 [Rhodospirillaceae bacterium]|nr:MAG: hypothetical protein EPO08_13210 [Rhodospirillaceae bacterium]